MSITKNLQLWLYDRLLHNFVPSARLFIYMEIIDSMFKAGAHYAFSRSRRHPSTKPYIFGTKNRVEIFDLEKTAPMLEAAKDFIQHIVSHGGNVLLLGGKSESRDIIKKAADSVEMPYVADRWIGGTFSNFTEIKKRIDKLATLTTKREKGELAKYTKKERLLIDREIDNLQRFFGGISSMKELPKVLFVVDHRREAIAAEEARSVGIPVVSLCGSDCNLREVAHPILGNDSSPSSIAFFVAQIVEAIKEGKKHAASMVKKTESASASASGSASAPIATMAL